MIYDAKSLLLWVASSPLFISLSSWGAVSREKREMFCTEQSWLQVLTFWCPDDGGKDILLFACSFLQPSDCCEQLQSATPSWYWYDDCMVGFAP